MTNEIASSKQKKKIIDVLLSAKNWLYANATIILIVWIIYIIFAIDNDIFDKLGTEKNELSKITTELAEINKEIQITEKLAILPELKTELEYAQNYFLLYNLVMEKTKTAKNANKQNITLKGRLINILLAIYDIKNTKLLTNFGNILIDNNKATAHLTIFGSR